MERLPIRFYLAGFRGVLLADKKSTDGKLNIHRIKILCIVMGSFSSCSVMGVGPRARRLEGRATSDVCIVRRSTGYLSRYAVNMSFNQRSQESKLQMETSEPMCEQPGFTSRLPCV